eukprot:3939929-Rhodomonas_salina.1
MQLQAVQCLGFPKSPAEHQNSVGGQHFDSFELMQQAGSLMPSHAETTLQPLCAHRTPTFLKNSAAWGYSLL